MKIRKVYLDLIIYDFDGVMTNNTVILNENGVESVFVNRSDGLAVSLIKKIGIPQIIVSTEKNPVVAARAKKLNIPYLQGVKNKKEQIKKYFKKNNIDPERVAYIGNDINDLESMKIVGFPIAPMDADSVIKKIAKIIIKKPGGSGVIREFLALLS